MSRLRGSLRWSLGAVVGIMLQLVNWAAWQAISQPGLTVVGGVVAFGVGAALLWRHRGDAAGAVTADTAPTAASMSAPPARTAGGATRVETPVTGSVEDLGRTPVASAWLWVALTVWLGLAFLADAAHQSMPPGHEHDVSGSVLASRPRRGARACARAHGAAGEIGPPQLPLAQRRIHGLRQPRVVRLDADGGAAAVDAADHRADAGADARRDGASQRLVGRGQRRDDRARRPRVPMYSALI
eukprot:Opistho-2@67426